MSQYSKKVFSKLAVILLIISMLIPQAGYALADQSWNDDRGLGLGV